MKESAEAGTLELVPESNPLRDLPRVDDAIGSRTGELPTPLLAAVVRDGIDSARRDLAAGDDVDVERRIDEHVATVAETRSRVVVNATGVLLHTNLGRARWPRRAVEAANEAAGSATNVEMSTRTGDRSRRGAYVNRLLSSLTGAEDAFVVNNNAGALLLALGATSVGRSVPVARGELIEIGGSYRLPDVMAAGGVNMVEVGTTNRTRIGDFETALQRHDVGAVLKVHPSNYRVEGFTEEPTAPELSELAKSAGIPFIYDIGSGLLDGQTPWLEGPTPDWLSKEPSATGAIAAGSDLVLFSGDKLLGGPQAGIAVGKSEVISKLRASPLARALRVDAVTLAALEATVEAYAEGTTVADVPFWAQATAAVDDVKSRAEAVAEKAGINAQSDYSSVGGGSVPGSAIPTWVVVAEGRSDIHRALLEATPPIIGRIDDGSLKLDLRTVDPADDDHLVATLIECL